MPIKKEEKKNLLLMMNLIKSDKANNCIVRKLHCLMSNISANL